jgi:hypothetical protein
MTKTPKRPRDPNQLAKLITEIATREPRAEKERKIPTKPTKKSADHLPR